MVLVYWSTFLVHLTMLAPLYGFWTMTLSGSFQVVLQKDVQKIRPKCVLISCK